MERWVLFTAINKEGDDLGDFNKAAGLEQYQWAEWRC